MRIVLDIRYRTRSGAASYIDNIVPGLTGTDSRHEFVVLRNHRQELPPETRCNSIVLRSDSAVGQAVYDQVRLPRLLRGLGADIYHPLKHLGTLYPPCLQVTTAHSITLPFRGEFPVSRAESIYWKVMGTRMFRRSATIIAVSEFVRDFLVEMIGIEPHRIQVVHHGVDPRFRLLAPTEAVRGRNSPYLLAVGNIFPVKNFVMAVRVLAALAAEFPDLRLKIAGGTHHPYCEKVRATACDAGILDRIEFLGFCAPEELVMLMNGAEMLLMPSLTEGFALTLVEAMACGTAVVASGRGAIPEVGREAARIVNNPEDQAAWIAAVGGLLRSPHALAELRVRARARSRAFTWWKAVQSTLDVYDCLEATGGRRHAIHAS